MNNLIHKISFRKQIRNFFRVYIRVNIKILEKKLKSLNNIL